MSFVLTCQDQTISGGVCSAEAWQDAYIIPAGQEEVINLLLTGGFSGDAFGLAFVGSLSLFAVGAGVGIIIAQIRRLK